MDWSRGYSASFYVMTIDPVTWRERYKIKVIDGNIKRALSGLRQSASLDISEQIEGVEQWVRIYMDTVQDGDYGHTPLFTGLATTPKRESNANLTERTVDVYSVLKPLDDIILQRGWYAYAGSSAESIISSLLEATPAPVEIYEPSPVLSTTIIAEEGDTYLSMLERVINACGWRIRILGTGTIQVCPYSTTPVARFDPLEYDAIQPPLTVDEDWYSAPNCYMAVSGNLSGVAKDNSADSPLSIINRGREVWRYEGSAKLSNVETIAEYATRKLKEAQKVQMSVSYDRRYVPDVLPTDTIQLHYPGQKVDGLYAIVSQNVKIGYNCTTSESVFTTATYDDNENERDVKAYLLVDDNNRAIVTDTGECIAVII